MTTLRGLNARAARAGPKEGVHHQENALQQLCYIFGQNVSKVLQLFQCTKMYQNMFSAEIIAEVTALVNKISCQFWPSSLPFFSNFMQLHQSRASLLWTDDSGRGHFEVYCTAQLCREYIVTNTL